MAKIPAYGTISKLRTQNWGKSDNIMPKTDMVKARITNHNIKIKKINHFQTKR